MRQYDSSLVPDARTQNAHDTRQCGSCLEDMTEQDIALDCVQGDGLCESCRDAKLNDEEDATP